MSGRAMKCPDCNGGEDGLKLRGISTQGKTAFVDCQCGARYYSRNRRAWSLPSTGDSFMESLRAAALRPSSAEGSGYGD